MADFRKLEVWVAAKTLAVHVYRLSGNLPQHERYNLTSQIQRSAVSVVANIAEGAGRSTDLDFARFVRIAMGSLSELWALLDLSVDLEILAKDAVPERQIQDLQIRLTNLLHRLERDGGRVREEISTYGQPDATVSNVSDR